MKFTESLWVSIEDIYDKILRHPFIRGLTDGSLDEEGASLSMLLDMRKFSRNGIAVDKDSLPLMLFRGDEKGMIKLIIRNRGKSVTV
jgi:hypothetical protein